MQNFNLNKVNEIIATYNDALSTIDSVIANTTDNKILGMALFASAAFNDRTFDASSANRRRVLMTERAKHFAWSELFDEVSSTDAKLCSYGAFIFASGSYYHYDVKQCAMSPFYLMDAYKGEAETYSKERSALAVPSIEALEKAVALLKSDDVVDGHHVWSFLNKCGASYKTDVTTFKRRMTFRGTADTYGSEWRSAFANMYRIFCQKTERDWSWDFLNATIRNYNFDFNRGATFDAFDDCFVAEKNANGNSTIIFTTEAVAVFNSIDAVEYKAAFEHVSALAAAIV